jgi:LCP family protein required for cell wall assembly
MTRLQRRSASSRKKIKKILLVLFLGIVILIGVQIVKYLPVFYGLTFKKEIALKQTEEKRINILLLGIGGGRHDGPNLTDTIIFVSLDPQSKKVTMVTIPRDLWVPDLKGRINSAYSTGQSKSGKGLVLAKAAVGKILGQNIDYGFRIDFNGFTKAVDELGGLDIDVSRTFDDYAYPLSGKENELCGHIEDEIASLSAQIATGSATESEFFPCRYEHLHFDEGTQHMDGETALKYVRSRHALGPEGSDFSRSKRQEKVINALKDKVFSAQTFLNPIKLVSLYDLFKDSIDTDIKKEEYDDFVRLAQKMKNAKIQSVVIDAGDESQDRKGLLENPVPTAELGYAWVLVPKAGTDDYSQIRAYVSCVIKYDECDVDTGLPLSPTPTISPTPSK